MGLRRGVDPSNDCLTAAAPCKTVEHAMEVATSGDTINVAKGSYKVRLELRSSTTLALLGGWDATFTTRDPGISVTTLKARGVRVTSPFGVVPDKRVVVVIAETGETITLTIDGFVVTGGRAAAVSPYLLGYPAPFPLQQDGGGGIYALAVGGTIDMTVRRSVITRNRSRVVAGGGAFVGASAGGTVDATFDRTSITENKVDYGGGLEAVAAGALSSVHVLMVNSIVAGNMTEGSAAIFALGFGGQTVLDLVDSTIIGNQARVSPREEEEVEGAIVLNRATANITNTIVWGNGVSPPGPGADLDVGQDAVANVSYSDVGQSNEVAGGVLNDLGGNLGVDPQLVGFSLGAGSPLIDTGTCTGAPPEDIEADPRPSGSGCDIGADEFVP